MVFDPRPSKGSRGNVVGRWKHWYTQIADWMIRNPMGSKEECAKALGKHVNTIYMVTNSDMFRDYFAQRREEWQRTHDIAIVTKTTAVAEAALDVMLEKLEKQSDKIPMNLVTEVAVSALDRLGYAPQSRPQVEVNVNTDNRKVVMVPISAGALEEARDAIRAAEAVRAISQREVIELEAEPEEANMQASEALDVGDASTEPPGRS